MRVDDAPTSEHLGLATPADAKAAVFACIEVFCNRIRHHSSIENLSPVQLEDRDRARPAVATG